MGLILSSDPSFPPGYELFPDSGTRKELYDLFGKNENENVSKLHACWLKNNKKWIRPQLTNALLDGNTNSAIQLATVPCEKAGDCEEIKLAYTLGLDCRILYQKRSEDSDRYNARSQGGYDDLNDCSNWASLRLALIFQQ